MCPLFKRHGCGGKPEAVVTRIFGLVRGGWNDNFVHILLMGNEEINGHFGLSVILFYFSIAQGVKMWVKPLFSLNTATWLDAPVSLGCGLAWNSGFFF